MKTELGVNVTSATPTWGYHLMVDASGLNPESIRSAEIIDKFARDLVVDIDMIPYGDPQIVHFGKDDKTGYTMVQLIETSNIIVHFCEGDNTAYFDVFSCKPFEPGDALNLIEKVFSPKEVKVNFIVRQAP